MTTEQRGSTYATRRHGIAIRWRDADGTRRGRSGFATKLAARRWLRDHLGSGLSLERLTFDELADEYLARHEADPRTIATLRARLKRPRARFGDVDVQRLEGMTREIAAWRRTLPERSRYGIVSAFAQVCQAGVEWKLAARNPVRASGRNEQPAPRPVEPLTRAQVDALAVELGPVYGPLVVLAAETALRPGEVAALEWRDIDRQRRVLRVERAASLGRVKSPKTRASRRTVPLSARALAALDEVPRRIDVAFVFPSPSGGLLDLHNWRAREWLPACELAGVRHRRIYDLRHTAISNWLAAGLSVFKVARYAGTSVTMVDRVYGHLLVDAELADAHRLDAWASDGHGADVTGEGSSGRNPHG